MTNREKIERIRAIYNDFMQSLGLLKKELRQHREMKAKAYEKAKINELLEQINKDY